jgi:uncharacterized protein YbaR (Trm112 family)
LSEHLLKILAEELIVARLVCAAPACGGTLEVPVAKLAVCQDLRCPVCRNAFTVTDNKPHPFAALAEALARVAGNADRVTLQFVIPVEE